MRAKIVAVVVLAVTLSGCTGIQKYIQSKIQDNSGILKREEYLIYQQYQSEGKIGTDNYYQENYPEEDYPEEFSAKDGAIKISFAKNNNLETSYFEDEECTVPLSESDCYLSPGDIIYANISVKDGVYSSSYEFSELRIYEIREDGSRKLNSSVSAAESNGTIKLMIPENCDADALVLEPIGKYLPRLITLHDFQKDANGAEQELDGLWTVNSSVYSIGNAEIGSVDSYIVSYQFDPEEYFYVSSSPEYFHLDVEDGQIIFKQRKASDETSEYSVELHPYLVFTMISDVSRNVSINGGNNQSVLANHEIQLGVNEKLKYGDTFTVQTDSEWKDLENCPNPVVQNIGRTREGGYIYTMLVNSPDGMFEFDPSDYLYEHGTILFSYLGKPVTGPMTLVKGSRLYYEADSAEEGYWLPESEEVPSLLVGEQDETVRRLKEIHFVPKVKVTVQLPQPEYGGKIAYYLNGKLIDGDQCETTSGAEISMDFSPWEGWQCTETDGEIYKVADQKNQIVSVNGLTVDTLFKEDDAHKPILTVLLEKSVEQMYVGVSAAGISEAGAQYSEWNITKAFEKNAEKYTPTGELKLVNGEKIGTQLPIRLSLKNRAILTGQAVRIQIEKTYQNEKKKPVKITETWYLNDLTKKNAPIEIYNTAELEKHDVKYDSIQIRIGVVEVQKFGFQSENEEIKSRRDSNIIVSVYDNDANRRLNVGNFVEPSSKVTVSISPKPGFYITGSKVSNDKFISDEMSYTEYLKRVDDLVENHPAKKYCTIMLEPAEDFAKATYRLDGKVVSDRVQAKEGQKLQLEYEIIDADYSFKTPQGGVFGLGSSDKKATKTISITSEMDGKTISNENFHIEVVKRG